MNYSIEEIISPSILQSAWEIVKSKNSHGGSDFVSVAKYAQDLRNNLDNLQNEVLTGNYFPDPYLQIFIKKIKHNEYRPISLLAVKDKIVQTSVKLFFEPAIDKLFTDTSYAYRPQKGHAKAIRRIKDFIARKYLWFLPIDIDDFFSSIPQDKLISVCDQYFSNRNIIELIKMWISVGVIFNNKYIENKKGIAQGGVLSPMLSNIYLNSLDHELKNRNFNNVRYADNILLIAKSKEGIKEELDFCQNYFNYNLSLKLNKINTDGCHINESGFNFCGIFFFQNFCKIASEKIDSIKKKLQEIIEHSNLQNLASNLFDHLQGLNRYYSPFDTKDQLEYIVDEIIKLLSMKVKYFMESNLYSKRTIEENIRKIDIPFAPLLKLTKNAFINKIFSNLSPQVDLSQKADQKIKRKISFQKRRFQKIWYENLDLMINTAGTQLGHSADKVIIRRNGKVINQISIKSISNILITSQGVSLSSNLIRILAEKNIRIDFFDEIGKPFASVIPSAAPLLSITNEQMAAQYNGKSCNIAKFIISAKIRNQMSVIKYFIKNKKTEITYFQNGLIKMQQFLEEIESMRTETEINSFRDKLLGYEGMSAAFYWDMFKIIIPQEYNFEQREHKNAENVVNCMLNYSYGILYSRVLAAITLAGLNPNIGFLHREQKGKPVLVFDLIEIFRAPVADRTVIAMLNKGIKAEIKDKILSPATKTRLAKNILFRLNKEIPYRKKNLSLNEIILEQAREICNYLKGEIKKYKPYLNKW